MAATPSTARTEFFKELKPRCVAINDLAVKAPDKRAVAKQLIAIIRDLSDVLETQITKDASVLDEKLADYVFFPLSNILRNQQQFPLRLTELTIRCLERLIQYGWKNKISGDLSQQLLIFLTYVIGGVPGQQKPEAIPEETTLEALKALASLVTATGASTSGSKSLVDDKNLPALGHTVTTIMDTITKGGTAEIQLESLQVLDAVITGVKDPVVLATFLPGIISSLSRLLTPPPAWKVPKKVLVKGIVVLRSILVGVLGDIKITKLLKKTAEPENIGDAKTKGRVFTVSWLKATAEQIKLALASILKLRVHKAEDVQLGLERLCVALLDECHQSLSICAQILVETAIILSMEDENHSLLNAGLNTSLSDLTGIYPELTDTVKTTVYNWVTSLPRIMQSSDEELQQQAIRNLLKGQSLISSLRIDSTTLNNTMAASLRDSVSALLASSSRTSNLAELPPTELVLGNNNSNQPKEPIQFRPFLMDQTNQRSTRTEMLTLISKSGTFSQHAVLAADMLEYLRESTGNTQVASYWLAFELVKAGLSSSSDLDQFIDFGPAAEVGESHEQVLQELYTFSITVLNATEESEEPDWRLPSLALEVTAFAASRMKINFRPELIDVLYPIATYLGSSVPQVREHAIMALNSIASSCDYNNVADLVIENVDYMLNSVSLRLNTFDISPASTQVLRMMIKLTGPRIIPFLDDVVASIFGALDNYHGYTLFVENLFAVLAEIVRQGAKSDQLLLEDPDRPISDHIKLPLQITKVEEIMADLDKRAERKRRRREEENDVERISHPKKPWKRREDQGETAGEHDGLEEGSGQEVEKKPPPKTPTYSLLTRITGFTQHYLTSPTPTLRKSLLDLLGIVCPALSPDEEAFLPVVNTIWPVLVERLYDPESFVVISACKALTALCNSAGDFLSSRIETEWSDGLAKWIKKAKNNATQSSRISSRKTIETRSSVQVVGPPTSELVIPIRSADGLQAKEPLQSMNLSIASQPSGAGLGEFTQARQIWEAVQDLLVGIVSFVRVGDDVFEQILALFGSEGLVSNETARKAFEVVNADAVWLVLFETGREEVPQPPPDAVRGMKFMELQIS
ncbi:HEAT repeat protein [Truncatella angustata]|uniref:HEAT repeat protein n=1 Tax=Truncatella angustata TaxID=152316 RepID=A0A9P8ZXW9_9PEZI|nr:HEAT repeat protein [Truncatella angustata]KAH6654424.1 HEAT repeat protein [Truncatella angustata]